MPSSGAKGETPLSAFFFCELFSLRLLRPKKKVGEQFAPHLPSVQPFHIDTRRIICYNSTCKRHIQQKLSTIWVKT